MARDSPGAKHVDADDVLLESRAPCDRLLLYERAVHDSDRVTPVPVV